MHGYKWPINCTRTRTEGKWRREELYDSMRAQKENAVPPTIHALVKVDVDDFVQRQLSMHEQAATRLEALRHEQLARTEAELQVMRASKMYVNLSHAWFLNYGLQAAPSINARSVALVGSRDVAMMAPSDITTTAVSNTAAATSATAGQRSQVDGVRRTGTHDMATGAFPYNP